MRKERIEEIRPQCVYQFSSVAQINATNETELECFGMTAGSVYRNGRPHG